MDTQRWARIESLCHAAMAKSANLGITSLKRRVPAGGQ